MSQNYLDFESPIAELEEKILDLQSSEENDKDKLALEISKLNESVIKTTE